jgi:Sec-independent protein translocase protein TatA
LPSRSRYFRRYGQHAALVVMMVVVVVVVLLLGTAPAELAERAVEAGVAQEAA